MGGNCIRSQPIELIIENKMMNTQVSELALIGPGRSSFLEPFTYDHKEQDDIWMVGPGRQSYCEPINFKFNSKLDELETDITNLTQIFDQVDKGQRKSSKTFDTPIKKCVKMPRPKIFKGILKSHDSSYSSSCKSQKSVTFNPLKITRVFQKRSLRGLIL